MATLRSQATLTGMDITLHLLPNPHPVETGWVDDALATAAAAGEPLGALVGRPLTLGDGIMLVGRPGGSTPDGYQLIDSRPLASAGPARYLQLLTFDGPRTEEWAEAEERASTGRVWPATREIPGTVRTMRMRRADNGLLVAVLAESADVFDAGQRAIMSTALLPGEDPALLTGPDRIDIYRLVHADLPVDESTS